MNLGVDLVKMVEDVLEDSIFVRIVSCSLCLVLDVNSGFEVANLANGRNLA